jgi:hypothetical protein
MCRHRSLLLRALALGLLFAALAPAAFAAAQPQPSPMQLATRGGVGELGPYRQLLADAIAETFKNSTPMSAFQAGLLRVSRAPQPGDYAVCLQTIENGRIAHFAAFITGDEVGIIRRAVGIDRCWLETRYSALPPPRPAKQKKLREQTAR